VLLCWGCPGELVVGGALGASTHPARLPRRLPGSAMSSLQSWYAGLLNLI